MSIQHLLEECSDSYENKLKSVLLKSVLLNAAQPTLQKPEGLYTNIEVTEVNNLISFFTIDLGETRKGVNKEMLGSLLLDSGCLSNVAGLQWWNSYLHNLSPNMKKTVSVLPLVYISLLVIWMFCLPSDTITNLAPLFQKERKNTTK